MQNKRLKRVLAGGIVAGLTLLSGLVVLADKQVDPRAEAEEGQGSGPFMEERKFEGGSQPMENRMFPDQGQNQGGNQMMFPGSQQNQQGPMFQNQGNNGDNQGQEQQFNNFGPQQGPIFQNQGNQDQQFNNFQQGPQKSGMQEDTYGEEECQMKGGKWESQGNGNGICNWPPSNNQFQPEQKGMNTTGGNNSENTMPTNSGNDSNWGNGNIFNDEGGKMDEMQQQENDARRGKGLNRWFNDLKRDQIEKDYNRLKKVPGISDLNAQLQEYKNKITEIKGFLDQSDWDFAQDALERLDEIRGDLREAMGKYQALFELQKQTKRITRELSSLKRDLKRIALVLKGSATVQELTVQVTELENNLTAAKNNADPEEAVIALEGIGIQMEDLRQQMNELRQMADQARQLKMAIPNIKRGLKGLAREIKQFAAKKKDVTELKEILTEAQGLLTQLEVAYKAGRIEEAVGILDGFESIEENYDNAKSSLTGEKVIEEEE